jgi:hypothetical protein
MLTRLASLKPLTRMPPGHTSLSAGHEVVRSADEAAGRLPEEALEGFLNVALGSINITLPVVARSCLACLQPLLPRIDELVLLRGLVCVHACVPTIVTHQFRRCCREAKEGREAWREGGKRGGGRRGKGGREGGPEQGGGGVQRGREGPARRGSSCRLEGQGRRPCCRPCSLPACSPSCTCRATS